MSKRSVAQLKQYFSASLSLIKLNEWDATRTNKKGKVVELGKAPIHKDWPEREYAQTEIESWMEDDRNVGVKLGDGWAVIDIDPRNGGLEGRRILQEQYGLDFEKCAYVLTGRGDGGMHVYVRIPEGWRGRAKSDAIPGVDFKHHKGMQVVSAGSRHPEGGFYMWAECTPLQLTAMIPDALLEEYAVKEPPEGLRGTGNQSFGSIEPDALAKALEHLDPCEFREHEDWLTLMMSVHWLSGGRARQEFVEWSTQDPDYEDDDEEVGHRWDSLSDDGGFSKRVVKGGYLFKMLNERDLGEFAPRPPISRDFDDLDDEEIQMDKTEVLTREMKVLHEMNKRHAVVNLQGKAFFLQYITDYDSYGHEVEKLIFSQSRDMREFYRAHQIVYKEASVSGGDPKTKQTNWFDFWAEHPQRRQYSSVIFDPDREKEFETLSGRQVLNLWEDFKFSKTQRVSGSWETLREMIWVAIADEDEEIYEYVLNWIAYSYQNPGKAQRTALVMKGQRGTGKGTLARVWLAPWGIHGMATEDGEDLFGKYNSSIGYKCGLFLDEAFWAGDKAKLGKLKARLTEPTFRVGEKFEPSRTVRNFLKVMIASNEDHVIPAAADDRRFMVIETNPKLKSGPEHPENKAFWTKLNRELANGGKEAFFYDMLHRDIGDFDPEFDRVVTDAMRYQVRATHGEIADWWISVLQTGVLPDQIGEWSHSPVNVPKASLRNHFDRYLGTRRGEWAFGFEKAFRSKFKELMPDQVLRAGRARLEISDDEYSAVEIDGNGRCYTYVIPSLPECREKAASMFGEHLFDYQEDTGIDNDPDMEDLI